MPSPSWRRLRLIMSTFSSDSTRSADAGRLSAATRKWYGRLLRLLPDIAFEITRIEVRGPPWNTIALADWNETNSGTDGVRTANTGLHVVHLAWGRMSRLQIITDTFALQETLDRLARAGVEEAHAPPIIAHLEGTTPRRFSCGLLRVLEGLGGRTRARTWDPMIKSHLLYQLSYAPGTGPEKPSQERRRLAKRSPMSSKARGFFPAFGSTSGH